MTQDVAPTDPDEAENPYVSPRAHSGRGTTWGRLRGLVVQLIFADLAVGMSVIYFLVASVYLLSSAICLSNYVLDIVTRNAPPAFNAELIGWGLGCFTGAILGFAAMRCWWRKEIRRALILSLVLAVVTVIVVRVLSN